MHSIITYKTNYGLKSQWDSTTNRLELLILILKTPTMLFVVKDVDYLELSYTAGGNISGTATLENTW